MSAVKTPKEEPAWSRRSLQAGVIRMRVVISNRAHNLTCNASNFKASGASNHGIAHVDKDHSA